MTWPQDGKPRFVPSRDSVLDRAYSHREAYTVDPHGRGGYKRALLDAAALRLNVQGDPHYRDETA